MNAAARLVHQGVLTRQLVLINSLSRVKVALLFFSFSLVMSAIGIIYVTEAHRIMRADYQRSLTEQDQLQTLNQQLILEKSTLLMQSRLEETAKHQLNMVYPEHKLSVALTE